MQQWRVMGLLSIMIMAIGLISCQPEQQIKEKSRCETIDWYQLGYQYGTKNQDYKQSDDYFSCRHGVLNFDPPEAEILDGYQDGLDAVYCTEENAGRLAKAGDDFAVNQCSEPAKDKLEKLYSEAMKAHCSKAANGFRRGSEGAESGHCEFFVTNKVNQHYNAELKKGHERFLTLKVEAINIRLQEIKSLLEAHSQDLERIRQEIQVRADRQKIETNKDMAAFHGQKIQALNQATQDIQTQDRELILEQTKLENDRIEIRRKKDQIASLT